MSVHPRHRVTPPAARMGRKVHSRTPFFRVSVEPRHLPHNRLCEAVALRKWHQSLVIQKARSRTRKLGLMQQRVQAP